MPTIVTPWTVAGKSEHSQQAALFVWANCAKMWGFSAAAREESYASAIPASSRHLWAVPELEWLHAIPNGGERSASVAASMKAEGVKRGVPDIFWPLTSRLLATNVIDQPFGIYPGLYIEMKVGNNKLSEYQNSFFDHAVRQGYEVVCCYSWTEAASAIINYYTNVRKSYNS